MENKIPKDAYAIIIGSMKSGTSSFYNYLIQHPKICPAITKEPEFFSENNRHGFECKHYHKLWEFNSQKHKVALEASTGYTKFPLEQNVPKNISEYGINPKLIYCVRNPFDRILSQHQFMKNHIRFDTHEILSEETINWSKYYMQLQHFREYFSKVQILIVDFDEIAGNSQKACNDVFDFLELDRIRIDSTNVSNKTPLISDKEKELRKHYKPLIKRIPLPIKEFGRFLLNKLYREKKKGISTFQKEEIFKMLQSDMQEFKKEYGFDTSKWGF